MTKTTTLQMLILIFKDIGILEWNGRYMHHNMLMKLNVKNCPAKYYGVFVSSTCHARLLEGYGSIF